MRVYLRPLLVLMCIFVFNGCNSDFWKPVGPAVNVEVNLTAARHCNYTHNGVNLKYSIEDVALMVGDTLKISIDSENEVKPLVSLLLNENVVMDTCKLPVEYAEVINEKGEYKVEFYVSNESEVFLFPISETITVN